jgi:hypothetical protein
MALLSQILILHLLWITTNGISLFRCINETSNAHVNALCKEQASKVVTYMPSNESIVFDAGDSNKLPDPNKHIYFPLCVVDSHRDGRFCKEIIIPFRKRKAALTACFREFSNFAAERNLKYWLIHGGLIGWYWNELPLPWDLDIDVSVLYYELRHDYIRYHGTVYKKRYVFEVNLNYKYRYFQETDKIDARFIDKQTGLYIDLTAVSYDATQQQLHCKSPHYYFPEEIFPLQSANFSGTPIWVPHKPLDILVREYPNFKSANVIGGNQHMFKINFGKSPYYFDMKRQQWIRGNPQD